MQADLFDSLARVVAYPTERYAEDFKQAGLPVPQLSLTQMEEIYTHTFDINPVCSLEVGWHLFGENYERGTFLVHMRQELRRHAVSESGELPDHLTNVLAAFGRMEAGAAGDFSRAFLLPALEKMLAGLEGKNNLYEDVLKAVRAAVAGQASACPVETEEVQA